MLWEFIISVATAVGTVAGSIFVIRAVVRHERRVCDERMEAFREGLDRYEKDKGCDK